MDVQRPLSTLHFAVGVQRPEAKLASWELISQGHDSLLQAKRLASVPMPVRRHNHMSLNRFDVDGSYDLSEDEEGEEDRCGEQLLQQEDEQEQDEVERPASPSPTASLLATTPRPKSFTADSKSYMAMRRGRRASLIAEVPETIDNACVSTFKSKARLLGDLEEASIMKTAVFRAPSLQPFEQSPFVRAAGSYTGSSLLSTAASDALLQQLQAASKSTANANHKPKPYRRATLAQLQTAPSTASTASSTHMSPTGSPLGSLCGNTLLHSPGTPAATPGRLPVISAGSNAVSTGSNAASQFSTSDLPSPGHAHHLKAGAQSAQGAPAAARSRVSDASASASSSCHSVPLMQRGVSSGSAGTLPVFEPSSPGHSAPLVPSPPHQSRLGSRAVNRRASMSTLLATHVEEPVRLGGQNKHATGAAVAQGRSSRPSSPLVVLSPLDLPSTCAVSEITSAASASMRGMSFTYGSNAAAGAEGASEAMRKLAAQRGRPASRLGDYPLPARAASALGQAVGASIHGGSASNTSTQEKRADGLISRFSKWVKGAGQ